MQTPPGPLGLYDPASSTTPVASRSSSTSRACAATSSCTPASSPCEPRAPWRDRAPSRTPATAPASSSRCPTASCARSSPSSASSCRRPAPTPSASPSSRRRRSRPRRPRRRSRRSSPTRASRVLGWRDVPVDPATLGATARAAMPSFQQLFVVGDPGGATGVDLDRKALRAPASGSSTSSTPSSRTLLPVAVGAHARLQGDAHDAAAGGVLPRPRRRARRERAAAGALPLLHQHVPVVAAGPPVPLRRPQRRDQHGAGQPQLDAGPRGAARQRGAARRPRAGLPDLHARRLRHGQLRRGARAAPPRRAPAAPRRADDDPRGVGEPRRDGRRSSGPSTASTRR